MTSGHSWRWRCGSRGRSQADTLNQPCFVSSPTVGLCPLRPTRPLSELSQLASRQTGRHCGHSRRGTVDNLRRHHLGEPVQGSHWFSPSEPPRQSARSGPSHLPGRSLLTQQEPTPERLHWPLHRTEREPFRGHLYKPAARLVGDPHHSPSACRRHRPRERLRRLRRPDCQAVGISRQGLTTSSAASSQKTHGQVMRFRPAASAATSTPASQR